MKEEYEERAGPSSGAIRTKDGEAGGRIANVMAPAKAACTFCRSRKSRCNGKQPCAACINRGRTDDCVYTISRRGGKPKPKDGKLEPLEAHLEKLFGLSDLPSMVRIPNVMPHLQPFQDQSNDFEAFQNVDPMGVISPNSTMNQPAYGYQPSITSPTNALPTQLAGQNDMGGAPTAKMLVGDFYTHIYRFVPILPTSRYHDTLAAHIQPASPLLFALRCIVPVLRNQPLLPRAQQAVSQEAKKDAIRAESQFYAKQAYDAIDDVLESVESDESDGDEYNILEVIQALCILVIYEYGSGRALKSRLKVDAALTLAMSRGLHRLSSKSRQTTDNNTRAGPMSKPPHYLSRLPEDELFDTKKRLWWTLWMLAMWTAYNTGRIPTVRADDSRVTSELPSCVGAPFNLWHNVVSSLQCLLLVQDRVLALTHIENGIVPSDGSVAGSLMAADAFNFSSPAGTNLSDHASTYSRDAPPSSSFSGQPTMLSREDILRSMLELDASMQEQMRILEQSTYGVVAPPLLKQGAQVDPSEDETQRILKFLWAIQVYTTSMTLHIGQAFQGASLFERKLCFLSSISEANDAAACQVPMPNAFEASDGDQFNVEPISMAPGQDLYARGPFLPRDSLARCVDASDKLLMISRNLRRSEGHMASPNPFNACSFVLISFVCLMQALAISSNAVQEGDLGALMGDASGLSSTGAQTSAATTQSSLATSNLLRSAQGAAALVPAILNGNSVPMEQDTVRPTSDQTSSRQMQLQQIWARVNEAKDALQGLSTYWDMVIPMREEVSGCLEASQFLLSQQPMS